MPTSFQRSIAGRAASLVVLVVTHPSLCSAATYYVSPQGDDSADGQSIEHPWKSCDKVDHAPFHGGDTILFQRGGEWRERLQASSSGDVGQPITYDAYGQGPKPIFWGSDVLVNANFKPTGQNAFTYDQPVQADSALADHVFIISSWAKNTLTITSDNGDPRTNGKRYTACTRGNEIFSNGKNHLIFRNLIVDETAGQLNDGPNQGYGVRIEGSTDVLLESCEAYRVGRHNFAFINSTQIVGRHLKAAYVVPNMPGDNTAYVSYADTGAPVAHCITTWDDISATHMENGHGGDNITFVSHGDQVGLLTIMNSTLNGKASFMSSPVAVRHVTLKDNASIENFGAGILIDGCTLLDSSSIDQYASDGIIQNCVAAETPTGGGPTGYSTAILLRDKSKGNVIRFNTLVAKNFSGICLAGTDAGVRWYGNLFDTSGVAVIKSAGAMGPADVAGADYNSYAPGETVGGEPIDAWKSHGNDAHSVVGVPQFVNAAAGDFHLAAGSPCVGVAAVSGADLPATDAADLPRAPGTPATLGAFEPVKH